MYTLPLSIITMSTFIISFAIFSLVMVAMAVGVIVNNRAIKGSCGGLNDIDGLEGALLTRPELFVSTFTEKLMTFALGRGVEPFDVPAVRKIVAESAVDEYRMSSIIVGIVNSVPFKMRTAL